MLGHKVNLAGSIRKEEPVVPANKLTSILDPQKDPKRKHIQLQNGYMLGFAPPYTSRKAFTFQFKRDIFLGSTSGLNLILNLISVNLSKNTRFSNESQSYLLVLNCKCTI